MLSKVINFIGGLTPSPYKQWADPSKPSSYPTKLLVDAGLTVKQLGSRPREFPMEDSESPINRTECSRCAFRYSTSPFEALCEITDCEKHIPTLTGG